MKLNIITINYNNAEGLRKTLASVAAQTYAHIEHIIVDGGSTDGSVEIIRQYDSANGSQGGGSQTGQTSRTIQTGRTKVCHQIRWISEPDKGIYHAMNKGIEIALGRRLVNDDHTSSPIALSPYRLIASDYIQILNSGDILAANDVTERMVEAMGNGQWVMGDGQWDIGNRRWVMGNRQWDIGNKNNRQSPIANDPQIPIFYGNMIKEWPDGKRVKDTCGGGEYTPESFLYFYKGTLNHDCAYIRSDLFEKYGLYNEEMKICSDWEWYVRAIVLGGEKTVYTNINVTVFDMTGISESNGKNKDIITKERREYLESILPAAVLRDYDRYCFPIEQYQRLKKYHLWGLVWIVERVIFKMEKWAMGNGR